MPGEMSRVMPVVWTSDLQKVVLEVPDENGKGVVDSDVCTWRQLLQELAGNAIMDPTVNCHELRAPMAAGVEEGLELI